MAVFDPRSRYVLHAQTRPWTDAQGRRVLIVTAAQPPGEPAVIVHERTEGQRLDHIAAFYLDDPHAYWRLCEVEDVLLPDALAEVDTVGVPRRG